MHGLVDPHSLVEALRDGQGRSASAPDSPSAIGDSKRYLEDFDRLQQSTTTDEELFNEMTKRYPDRESNQSWLMFGFSIFPEPMED